MGSVWWVERVSFYDHERKRMIVHSEVCEQTVIRCLQLELYDNPYSQTSWTDLDVMLV